jgi:amidase
MSDPWRLSAGKLADLVRRRKLSAREAALDGLARLDAVNPQINAVVDQRPETTLAQADAVDARIARGEDPGPLAGVPVTIKVNADQAGCATTNGVTLQRDLVAQANNPVVDSLLRAGAVVLGRTNTPAFSYRWFTDNRLHGATKNPRDPSRTPGGSSGGAAACVAAGIGQLAHGTDIAGSIRYPAYACGVHGLRPTPGRVAAYNASSPERSIGPQLTAVSGPIGRTIADLRLALAAMSAPDPLARDPWWTPAPLEGPPVAKRVALCLRPDGLDTAPEITAALLQAARRLEAAGWHVEPVNALPPLREAAELQTRLWLGDGFASMLAAAEREGDPGALTVLRFHTDTAGRIDLAEYSRILTRRATLVRMWRQFLETTAVVLLPVSAELPFPVDLDRQGDAAFSRVWEAQMTQIAIPLLGVPALTVATDMVGTVPVGVQLLAGRFREDFCLLAGEAVEAGGVPPAPVDPWHSGA